MDIKPNECDYCLDIKASPYKVIFKEYALIPRGMPGKAYLRFRIPSLIKVRNLILIDYWNNDLPGGLIKNTVLSVCNTSMSHILRIKSYNCTQLFVLVVDAQSVNSVFSQYNNFSNKIAAFYGRGERDRYIEERNRIFNKFTVDNATAIVGT